MSIEKFVEEQIRKAVAEGEFDNLPGRGRPVDLDAYFQTPEDLRLCYSMLRNAKFVPEEVETLREIEALRERQAGCADAGEKARLEKSIQEKVLSVKLALERYKRRR